MENLEKKTESIFQSTTAKMMLVGFLTLVLLIPLELVKNLISERSERQKEVVKETTHKWGESIYFYGPILKIPYTDPVTKEITHAYFFPEHLTGSTTTDVKPPLQRGLYQSDVFTASMHFTGNYSVADFSKKAVPQENILWDKASIIIKTSNLKSVKSEVKILLNNQQYTFEPTETLASHDTTETLETRYIDYSTIANQAFKVSIVYNGSKKISVVPIGKTTEMQMTSNWSSPKFDGKFLPSEKKITDSGFTAKWNILHFNRPFSQEHFEVLPDLRKYTFDVEFFQPVDEYQQNERASKYGFLVIGLTFLLFFLIQSISKINIHIFQYTMIGLALVLFYTLLISITEHSSFTLAYCIAASSVIVLIVLYSISVLRSKKFPVFIGLALTALYSFIYIIIQLEDYALLVGSIGLFCILATVMYFSRKIDWK
jgi:inner membrane protein